MPKNREYSLVVTAPHPPLTPLTPHATPAPLRYATLRYVASASPTRLRITAAAQQILRRVVVIDG